jgi:hypothetical protein
MNRFFIIIFLLAGVLVGLSNNSLAKQTEKEKLGLFGPVKKVIWIEKTANANSLHKSTEYIFAYNGLLIKKQEKDMIKNRVFETTFDDLERESGYLSNTTTAHFYIYNDAEKKYHVTALDSEASNTEKGILDSRGNIISREILWGPQNKVKLYTYEYDVDGKLIHARMSDETGSLALVMTMQYNANEQIVKEIYPAKAGDVVIAYEYDHKGLLTKVIDNLILGTRATVFTYQKMDGYGNWTSRTRQVEGKKIITVETREIEYF